MVLQESRGDDIVLVELLEDIVGILQFGRPADLLDPLSDEILRTVTADQVSLPAVAVALAVLTAELAFAYNLLIQSLEFSAAVGTSHTDNLWYRFGICLCVF